MRSVLVALSLAASAFALSVIYPSPSQGWPATGPQEVKWVKTAATDPQNVTVVLTGDATLLPNGPLVLVALTDVDPGSTIVRPPATGWPVGEKFRIELAKSASELTTIITTSDAFSIGIDLSSSTSSSSSSSVGRTSTPSVPTNVVNTPSGSAGTTSPTDALGQKNSALSTLSAQSGLVPMLAMIGFAFA